MSLATSTSSSKQTAPAHLALVLLLTVLAVVCRSAQADLFSASVSSSGDSAGGEMSASPKRQYFIAPRVGRAPSGNAAIWSALEEGAFSSAGQIQPTRGFPGPLRSSLLFLVGNRQLGTRSSGLLPQARIGRRSAPVGLMPQPRVGRRSVLQDGGVSDESEEAGQQEIAVPTLADNSYSEAIEALMA